MRGVASALALRFCRRGLTSQSARILKDSIRRGGGEAAGLQLYNGSFDDESRLRNRVQSSAVASKQRCRAWRNRAREMSALQAAGPVPGSWQRDEFGVVVDRQLHPARAPVGLGLLDPLARRRYEILIRYNARRSAPLRAA
jgi:hypothetical protein